MPNHCLECFCFRLISKDISILSVLIIFYTTAVIVVLKKCSLCNFSFRHCILLLCFCCLDISCFFFLQKPITDEQRTKISHLSAAAEKLFDLLDNMTEGSKKKAALCWPLQTMLLVLCPVECLHFQ